MSTSNKDELIEAVDAMAEHIDTTSDRVSTMLAEIDFLIVRMNGPSTQYREQLEEIATKHGFRVSDQKGERSEVRSAAKDGTPDERDGGNPPGRPNGTQL